MTSTSEQILGKYTTNVKINPLNSHNSTSKLSFHLHFDKLFTSQIDDGRDSSPQLSGIKIQLNVPMRVLVRSEVLRKQDDGESGQTGMEDTTTLFETFIDETAFQFISKGRIKRMEDFFELMRDSFRVSGNSTSEEKTQVSLPHLSHSFVLCKDFYPSLEHEPLDRIPSELQISWESISSGKHVSLCSGTKGDQYSFLQKCRLVLQLNVKHSKYSGTDHFFTHLLPSFETKYRDMQNDYDLTIKTLIAENSRLQGSIKEIREDVRRFQGENRALKQLVDEMRYNMKVLMQDKEDRSRREMTDELKSGSEFALKSPLGKNRLPGMVTQFGASRVDLDRPRAQSSNGLMDMNDMRKMIRKPTGGEDGR
mmetsp:Transcript_4483/g.16940  ORF Transcript_4483/g.16940 Transcript_4483/m.16940 type:complete len:366 (-) Transcript_4483:561-1658(-)